MGVRFEVEETTEFLGLDGEPFGAGDLRPGEKISAILTTQSNGRRVAREIKRRKSGGKAKIEGIIERTRELEGGLLSITVLGTDILIAEDLDVAARRPRGTRDARTDVLSRVLAGDFLDKGRELYEVARDPGETRNIVDEQPNVAHELEGVLAAWTESLMTGAHTTAAGIDVDPETMEQLRRMGYVD
jgi:hypothetical protein